MEKKDAIMKIKELIASERDQIARMFDYLEIIFGTENEEINDVLSDIETRWNNSFNDTSGKAIRKNIKQEILELIENNNQVK